MGSVSAPFTFVVTVSRNQTKRNLSLCLRINTIHSPIQLLQKSSNQNYFRNFFLLLHVHSDRPWPQSHDIISAVLFASWDYYYNSFNTIINTEWAAEDWQFLKWTNLLWPQVGLSLRSWANMTSFQWGDRPHLPPSEAADLQIITRSHSETFEHQGIINEGVGFSKVEPKPAHLRRVNRH